MTIKEEESIEMENDMTYQACRTLRVTSFLVKTFKVSISQYFKILSNIYNFLGFYYI